MLRLKQVQEKILKNRFFASLYKKYQNTPIMKFTSKISVVYIYFALSSLIGIPAGIITARVLGPLSFGKIGIAGNISSFLFIFFCAGIHNAMYKYLPGVKDQEEYKSITATSFFLTLFIAVIFSITCIFFKGLAVHYLKITNELWLLAIVSTILIIFNSLTESFLRGRQLYTIIGKIRLLRTVINTSMIIIFFWALKKKMYIYHFVAMFVSQGIYITFIILYLKISFRKFSPGVVKKILNYGFKITINTFFNTLLMSSDTLILNYFYPDSSLTGIYIAYENHAKNIFMMVFYEIFMVVFMPTIAQMNVGKVYNKIKKKSPFFLTFIFIIVFTGTSVLIGLHGKEYGFNPVYLFLVSLGVGFYAVFQLYNTVFNMDDNSGIKVGIRTFQIVVPFSLIIQILLIKYFCILGGMVSILLTNLLLVIVFKILINTKYKKLLHEREFD